MTHSTPALEWARSGQHRSAEGEPVDRDDPRFRVLNTFRAFRFPQRTPWGTWSTDANEVFPDWEGDESE